MNSFVVELWLRLLKLLSWLTPFKIIRTVFPATKASYAFVDLWAIGNWSFSIVAWISSHCPGLCWWEVIPMVWGPIRIFELLHYHASMLLGARKPGSNLASYRRSMILSLYNYTEIIFWFAMIYRNLNWAFEASESKLDSLFESLNFSFVTMTTFGATKISPLGSLGTKLIFIQSAIGLFMILVVLTRFISFLPKPETQDKSEK